MKEKINSLEENAKNQAMTYIMLEKELDQHKLLKGKVETRLGEAQQKLEKLGALELEKQRLLDKEKYYNESLDYVKAELLKAETKNKTMKDEIGTLLKAQEEAQSYSQGALRVIPDKNLCKKFYFI